MVTFWGNYEGISQRQVAESTPDIPKAPWEI
ncbi:hypothetical protein [Escherichia coli]